MNNICNNEKKFLLEVDETNVIFTGYNKQNMIKEAS